MRWSGLFAVTGLAALAVAAPGQAQAQSMAASTHMNPMIPLLQAHLPILGVNNPTYAQGRGGGGGGGGGGARGAAGAAAAGAAGAAAAGARAAAGQGGAAAAGARAAAGAQGARAAGGAPATPPAPIDMNAVAKEIVDYKLGDYVLNTFSNGTVDAYRNLMKAIVAAGGSAATHPFVAKVPIIPVANRPTRDGTTNPQAVQQQIIAQLNEGQVMIEMQQVETVAEIDAAVAAMRFTTKGGVRPTSGFENAAAYWKMTPAQYLEKADVWPVNPNGELLISIIIESKEGVANARALAGHPAVSVVTVGAGTMGGVYRTATTNADGTVTQTRDQAGFDAAVAQVLAACKEFKKSCGYPANNPTEVENLMKAGWDMMIMQRRDQAAFDAVLTGRRLGNRPTP